MRINKYVAQATGMSRRAADTAIANGRVYIEGAEIDAGYDVTEGQTVLLDGKPLRLPEHTQTILLNKPVGYVCSRQGQGNKTIYDLIPENLHHLKPIGRLDKDSSGLLLLTNDGVLAHQLTHPSFQKEKVYEVSLDKPLSTADIDRLTHGVELEDGISHLQLKPLDHGRWQITMHEGRNRQIRRTFERLGYRVTKLHRTTFGPYMLDSLPTGQFNTV